MILRGFITALGLTLPVLTGAAQAAEPLDGRQIAVLINEALEEAGQSGRALVSPNRGFPACSVPPVVARGGRDWSTARVSCPEGREWSRVVRIKDAARAPRAAQVRSKPIGDTVWVLDASLPRGTVIAAHHLRAMPVREVDRMPDGVIEEATRILGRTLKANLGEGRVIQARHLEHDWFVTKGDRLVIEARVGAASIQTGGVALENGQLGQRVRVENARSGRAISATVKGRNFVVAGPNIQ